MNNNWISTNLEDLFDIKYGKGLPEDSRNKTGEINVYGSNGIIGRHDKTFTNGTTIIIGRKGSVGEVNFSVNSCWPIDTTYYIDNFHGNIPPKYWMYLLKSLNLGCNDKSSAIPGINRNDIYKLEFLLPPLKEQHRIVSKLEKLLSKVEACKDRLKKIPLILKRFRQSVLASACSGRLTADWREKNPGVEPVALSEIEESRLSVAVNKQELVKLKKYFSEIKTNANNYPSNWLVLHAELLCHFITKGATPDSSELSDKGDIPFIKVHHIIKNKLEFDSRPVFISRHIHENDLRRSRIYPRDVIMNIVGPPLNKVAIIPDYYNEWNINQAIAIFRAIEWIIPKYIYIVLSFEGTLKYVIQDTKGIVGQSNISLEQCRKLVMPVPPLPEQQEIVRRVESLFKLADTIEGRYEKTKVFIEKLSQSILSKAFRGELVPHDPSDEPASAFRGELVPHDPSDEPASVLLELIRKERAGEIPKNNRKKPLMR